MKIRSMVNGIKKELKLRWGLYILLLPTLIYVLIFLYGPMGGVLMAFQDYKSSLGLLKSPFVGLKHFRRFLTDYNFKTIFSNTLIISFYSLIAGFPFPIIFALFTNTIKSKKLKNFIKTASYAPHFISVVVIVAMINLFFAPTSGVVVNIYNNIRSIVGLEEVTLGILTDKNAFYHLYVWSGIWQELGWNSIVYIAALSAISPDLYEAANIDGASRIQCIRYIDFPSILPTIVTLLNLNTGNILSIGFEKAYLMQNNLNIQASEIISTYVYKVGLNNAMYSFSTAVGLFNSIINLTLLLIVNAVSKKLTDIGIL